MAPLKVIDFEGNDITSLGHRSKLVRRGHWKPGRSAYSLADFMLNRLGAAHLEYRLASVLSEPVGLEQGTPEYAARFDGYEGPARLDLGISGQTASGQSLFVGLEAKVDEPFGSETVGERYQLALETLRGNPRSKAAARIKELLFRYFGDKEEPGESKFADIGYQLLTAAAGMVAAGAELSVLYVAVFRTMEYSKEKGKANRADYDCFMRVSGAQLLVEAEGTFSAHQLTLDGRHLVCIYEQLDFQGYSQPKGPGH